MATTKKALAMAEELVSELKQRQSALAVAMSFDTDGNPLVKLGSGTAGQKNALIKIMPIDWPLAKDILGLASPVYTPHKVMVAFEANPAGGAGADVNDWPTLLVALGSALAKGARVEVYESANGDSPDADDLIAANLKASFDPSVQYPMVSSQ
jgi:hypothetical protein